MGKKYEPVPDAKRKQLISLIYERGMNISKASKEAGIYYPTAKAINKIYLRQNRICKKTNRDRTKKNHNITIKVQSVDKDLLQNSPFTKSCSESSSKNTNGLQIPAYATGAVQSTACSHTENDFSHNSPSKIEFEPEIQTQKEHDISYDNQTHNSYYSLQPETQSIICPFHTYEGQAQISQIMKFVARIKAASCNSCNDLMPMTTDQIQYEQSQPTDLVENKRKSFKRQCTATFGGEVEIHEEEEEKVLEVNTDSVEDSKPIFHFQKYSDNTIQRPIPVMSDVGESIEEQTGKMEELLADPVVQYYVNLPMAGCVQEQETDDSHKI